MAAAVVPPAPTGRSRALVDLDAVAHNMRNLLTCSSADLIAVVKADGYGHGVLPIARTVVAAGASRLAVATLDEAVTVAAAGLGVPVICWLWGPWEDPAPALAAGVEIVVSSVTHLNRIVAARGDRCPRIHLKADTGLGRGGATGPDWAALCRAAAEAEAAGQLRVVALMSHLASADEPGDGSVEAQTDAFLAAATVAEQAGLTPEYRHLANSAGMLTHPDTHFDAVRVGIALYGLDPLAFDGIDRGLRPAMTLQTRVALTKRVPTGHGVSYGLTYRTPAESTLALVPLGYADGIPRSVGGTAQVQLRGRRYPIVGRVAMDQFVLDVGNDPVQMGDEVTLFGPGDDGEPTARDWAAWAGTIDYEIVTRIGARVPREYLGGQV